jgi:hypothetical protein
MTPTPDGTDQRARVVLDQRGDCIDREAATAMMAYISSIRNDAKRAYAGAYASYLLTPATDEGDPSYPDSPSRRDLSTMAAQAVRMRLESLRGS